MDCIFCAIIAKKIKADWLYEDEDLIAFSDIHPQAPVHVLFVPKQHLATISEISFEQSALLGTMILQAKLLAEKQHLDKGYRLVFNINEDGGQTVPHIHLHLLGGRPMQWPPG